MLTFQAVHLSPQVAACHDEVHVRRLQIHQE